MNNKHQFVDELSLIQVMDTRADRPTRRKIIGIVLHVQKLDFTGQDVWESQKHGGIKRAFEILWLDTQQRSAHVQFEDGAFDAFINEFVIRVYTQEELSSEIEIKEI